MTKATLALLALAVLAWGLAIEKEQKARSAITTKSETNWPSVGVHRYLTTHQQEIWISALEWCESRGIKEAINPKDRDGTPSYYSWQFKPDTFERHLLKYELALPTDTARVMELMKDYDLTREIVRRMVGDPSVDWPREFPECVRRLGKPPK